MNNIVLIGFMGSGKSSVGRLLAKQSGRYFLDTDALIESMENRKIRDIFSEIGEDYFRRMEKSTFAWICESVKNAVISTGGGMPTTIGNMREGGKVVYLKIGFDALLERLKAEEFEKRPLFENLDFAKKLYESRLSIYEKVAQITVDASSEIDTIVQTIKKQI